MRLTHLLLLLAVIGFVSPSLASEVMEESFQLYVAPGGNDQNTGTSVDQPFATITRARDAIREFKKKNNFLQPVEVNLRGGIYSVTEPIEFTPEDNGKSTINSNNYQAYKNETPVISGGKPITGWKKFKDNIWITEIPEVKEGKWKFNQLYVNGVICRRARIPNEGFLRVAGLPDGDTKQGYQKESSRFEFKPGDMKADWTNLEDVEVVFYHFWTDSHLPIKSIDSASNTVTFRYPAHKVFTNDDSNEGGRYIIENVFEGMDQPGEWYLNRKTGILYYIPRPGEDLEKAEVVAPFAPALIRIKGDAIQNKFVENIRFTGISFMYTNFQLPEGNSNDAQGSSSVPAAITLTGARDCNFFQCKIANLGTFAFDLMKGCIYNIFQKNTISNIAAGGFRINGGTEKDHPLERSGWNVIEKNILNHYGEIYPSAVGILLMNTESNKVTRNAISYGWYTGISIGWSWGYQRSISRDNIIEGNYIHHIGQGLLSDMGGIYTLGVSPGTVIRNNLIHDIDANHYGGWGIYNDEGSTHILVENNIVYNTKFAGYDIHYAKEITCRNNIFAFGRLQQLNRTRMESHESVYFENNIIYFKEGTLFDGNWKDKEYESYFNPIGKDGTAKVNSTFTSDWNIFFNPLKPLSEITFDGQSFEEWQKRGKDVHSQYIDPMFEDAEHYDFRLKPESPALKMGFKPINIMSVENWKYFERGIQ